MFRHFRGRIRFEDDVANAIMARAAVQTNLAAMRGLLAERWPTLKALMGEAVVRRELQTPAPRCLPTIPGMCSCGNAPAKGCEKGCCRTCCVQRPGLCPRHRMFAA